MKTSHSKKKEALKILNEIEIIKEQKKIKAAREDFGAFCEFVIKDESSGKPIKLAQLQRSWISHIAFCIKHSIHALILAPMSSGKTQVVSVALPLYFVGRDVTTRIKMVCLSDDSAKERLGAIRNYIENDEEYRKVFPGVLPDANAEWTRHRLFLKRPTKAKDASIDAKGVTSSGIGGRCDRLLVDDIFDYKTAIAQPASREQINATYNVVWLTRLEPKGNAVIICTRWHERDLAGEILANTDLQQRYGILIQRVSDDLSNIDVEVLIPDKLKNKYVNSISGFELVE